LFEGRRGGRGASPLSPTTDRALIFRGNGALTFVKQEDAQVSGEALTPFSAKILLLKEKVTISFKKWIRQQ